MLATGQEAHIFVRSSIIVVYLVLSCSNRSLNCYLVLLSLLFSLPSRTILMNSVPESLRNVTTWLGIKEAEGFFGIPGEVLEHGIDLLFIRGKDDV